MLFSRRLPSLAYEGDSMPSFKRRRVDFVDPSTALAHDGFAILRNAVRADLIARLADLCDAVPGAGIRNLFDVVPEAREVARAEPIRAALRRILGSRIALTRAILFDKQGAANWSVPWHQDTVIAVERKVDTPGFGPWSIKQGVTHVTPPARVLESMLTVRVHLDDADATNGALSILPRTHTRGILDDDHIRDLRDSIEPVLCECRAGDALLMRPLLLHASARSTSPRRRRVIHLEYGTSRLPGKLQWARA